MGTDWTPQQPYHPGGARRITRDERLPFLRRAWARLRGKPTSVQVTRTYRCLPAVKQTGPSEPTWPS